MITDCHVRMMDGGITREAEGRLLIEDSFNNGQGGGNDSMQPLRQIDTFAPLSHRQDNQLINGDDFSRQ